MAEHHAAQSHLRDTGPDTGRNRRRLALVLGLTAAFAVVELVVGLLSGSLALQADAAHMATDVAGLGLALGAVWLAARPASPRATYGYYRLEILAALANALLLLAAAGYILYEAWERFQQPPSVAALPMFLVGLAGLGVNLLGLALLHAGARGNLNVRGAFLEVASDALASLAVLVAAGLTGLTGWVWADPLFAALIGLFIVPRTWHLVRSAIDVLLEATPRRIDVGELERGLLQVAGVRRVHDVHVWTITSGWDAMSGHVEVDGERTCGPVLREMRRVLRDRFGIEHATIQVEEPSAQVTCAAEECRPS